MPPNAVGAPGENVEMAVAIAVSDNETLRMCTPSPIRRVAARVWGGHEARKMTPCRTTTSSRGFKLSVRGSDAYSMRTSEAHP